MSRALSPSRGERPGIPAALSPLQAVLGLVVPLLALVADAIAFFPILAIVLPALPGYFLIPIAVALAAGAVWLSDRIGLGLRQRRANDPTQWDALTWSLLALWIALGVGMFLARLLLGGGGGVTFSGAPPEAGSIRDVFGAITFAGLYVLSGAIAMATAFWLYRPAREVLARATAALAAAEEHEQECRRAAARAKSGAEAAAKGVAAAYQGARHHRALIRHGTDIEVWALKILARREMAARVKDPRGKVLGLFMEGAPTKPELPEEQP
jgi:hypothetical protein